MSKTIEVLIKVLKPKCVHLEMFCGSGELRRDQIISAIAFAEKESALGYALLLAKYAQDKQARAFLSEYVKQWANEFSLSNVTIDALRFVIDMLTDVPLPSQLKHLRALRNRYMCTKFSHIKTVQKANKIAQKNNISPNSPEARQIRILELNKLIRSNICPRCRGNGEIGRVQKRECPECNGKGRLMADIYSIMKSLDCTEAHFKRYIHAAVVGFEQHCYHEMSKAENAIKVRLKREIEN